MKDINYALMLIKAHKFEGAKDVLGSQSVGNQTSHNLGMPYGTG